MSCFYHPNTPATCQCRICGRGLCNDCIAKNGDMICKSCIASKVDYAQKKVIEERKWYVFSKVVLLISPIIALLYGTLFFLDSPDMHEAISSSFLVFLRYLWKGLTIAGLPWGWMAFDSKIGQRYIVSLLYIIIKFSLQLLLSLLFGWIFLFAKIIKGDFRHKNKDVEEVIS